MPTVHTWKPTSRGFMLAPANFVDGTAFAPGDTLVVNAGAPNAGAAAGATLGTLTTGTFVFNETGGADESLLLNNVALDGASSLTVTGALKLNWSAENQFVNDGLVQLGTATASGSVFYNEVATTTTQQSQLTNNGTLLLQNASLFEADGDSAGSTLLNNPGGVVSVNSGSLFQWGAFQGADYAHIANVANNGLVLVNGATGRGTGFEVDGDLSGSGLLSVNGPPGTLASNTLGEIHGTSTGTIDVAGGEVTADGTLAGGSITFEDGDGLLHIASTANKTVGAVLAGFQAGDAIDLDGLLAVSSIAYDATSHALTLNNSDGSTAARFTLAGSYVYTDFKLASANGGLGWLITTTSTANAVPAFSTQDTVTKAAGSSAGQQYTGPVNYLQSQCIWSSPDGVSIAAGRPNVFLQGGSGNDAPSVAAGSNVLDGGLGSNFLTGATGADGGDDTFYLDGTAGTTWDTIANFHPGDSVTLWGYVPGQSATVWGANEGAAGHTGATIHAAFAGAGTAVNGSVTFAGLGLADAQSKITLTPGTAGGRSYLYAHYNG